MKPRILIVNVNWLGDALFSTPAIRAVRKKFPESYLACLIPPRCAPALRHNPNLNELILYDDRATLFSFGECLRVVRELRKRNFDTAIFFHRSKTKVFLAKLAGIPRRLGYSAPLRDGLLTETCPPTGERLHKIDVFLHLLKHFGIPAAGRTMDFYPAAAAEEELRNLLAQKGFSEKSPYAVLHAGGNWELKRWPADYFVEWIRLFQKNFKEKIVLCGTEAEENISREIVAHFPGGEVVSLCGKTSLDALAVLLRGARFVLSNDSGPIHLAATQKTKIIGLFGPTSPDLTGPVSEGKTAILRKDVGCEIPCYYRSCNHRVCMELLTPEEVYKKTEELLHAG